MDEPFILLGPGEAQVEITAEGKQIVRVARDDTLATVAEPPLWLHVVIWPPLILGGSLALLRPMKGVMIALQYHHKASDSGTESYD
jgi:uncharacterized protein (DUF983 family)